MTNKKNNCPYDVTGFAQTVSDVFRLKFVHKPTGHPRFNMASRYRAFAKPWAAGYYPRRQGGSSYSTRYKRKPVTTQRSAQSKYKLVSEGGPGLAQFPATNTVAMRWAGSCNLGTSGVAGDVHVYAANSIYDPDYTSAGGFSAMGYDEWLAFYNHYLVDSATISATFTIPASIIPSPSAVLCYIKLVDDTTDDSEQFSTWGCNGNTVWKQVAQGTNAVTVTLTKTFNCASFFNLANPQDAQARVGAPFGSNPPEGSYFMVGMSSIDGVPPIPPGEATEYPCVASVLLTYNTTLSEPKALTH